MARGAIKYLDRYKQLLSFEGLEFERKITPTDFDMVIDFGRHEWVLGEIKLRGTPLQYGQRLALTNALTSHYESGVSSLGLIAYHDKPPDEIIIVRDLTVVEVWFSPFPGWKKCSSSQTVLELVKDWRQWNIYQKWKAQNITPIVNGNGKRRKSKTHPGQLDLLTATFQPELPLEMQ